MPVRKFSFLFFIFSSIAGIIGAFVGEWLLGSYYGIWPNLILMATYFGQLALIAGFCYLLAEVISPVITSKSWRLEYSGLSWKLLVPASLGLLFAAGLILQFLYSINLSNMKPPDDYVIVLDISDSMNETDPNRESLKAAKQLLSTMDSTNRVGVISFNDQPAVTKNMFEIHDQVEINDALEKIDSLEAIGKTDIAAALDTAIVQIEQTAIPGRTPIVMLFSDGYSQLDLNKVLQPYQENDIIIHTIGMSKIDRDGARLLKQIASGTGGTFSDVHNVSDLTSVFERIYLENQDRLLVTERHGVFTDSSYLAVLRVLFLAIIGALFGLMLGIVFDNRYLAKSYVSAGLISGLLAGLVLEIGLQNAIGSLFTYRLIAAVLLTVGTGLGTVVIPIREKYSSRAYPSRNTAFSSSSYSKKDHSKKGF